jgi:uncharacterized protein
MAIAEIEEELSVHSIAKDGPSQSPWALITGASEGLGLAFAERFARRGMNLVLVARTGKHLDEVASRLAASFAIRTLQVPLDLSDPLAPAKLKAIVTAKNIKIQLLLNNAGSGYWGEFDTQPLGEVQNTLTLNNMAMVSLCHLFMEDLGSHEKSYVINVSSVASLQPIPYTAVYAASKSFVQSFSQALHFEWKERGIYVQTLSPGAMETGFNAKIGFDTRRMKNIFDPEEVVSLSLKALEKGDVTATAARSVYQQKFFANFFPPAVVLKTVGKMFKPTERPPSSVIATDSEHVCSLCEAGGSIENASDIAQVPSNVRKFKGRLFTVWRCRTCRSLHAKEKIDFAEAYTDYPVQKQKFDFFCRMMYRVRLRQLVKGGLRREHTILDYGCGVGNFVTYLKSKGYRNAFGYDPYVEKFSDKNILAGRFDFVVSQDIIEHVSEPKCLIQTMRSLLTKGGVLCIGTPDAQALSLSSAEDIAWNLHEPFHRHILSARQLSRMVEGEGLLVDRLLHQSYFDTMWPAINSAFLRKYIVALDGTLDSAFEKPRIGKILSSPKLLWFLLFGYFHANGQNIVLFARERKGRAPGSAEH